MAWTCKKCATEVSEDDLVCTQCEAPKTVWTMVAEKTRTFTISGARVEYKRGRGYAAKPPGDRSYDPGRVVPADCLYVYPKADALRVREAGLEPPSVHIVTVRLFPKKKKELEVQLTINFAEAEEDDREFPYEGDPVLSPEGYVDVRFLFVFGEGDLADVSFPDVHHVVDVSEETDDGFAPSVDVSALRKKPQELEAKLLPPWFEAQLIDLAGGSFAGWGYELTLPDGQARTGEVDADNVVHEDEVPQGACKLRLVPKPADAAGEPAAEEELVAAVETGTWDTAGEDDALAGGFRFSV